MRISDWSSDVCSSDLLDQWRGKLAGRIVLVTRPDEGSEPDRAPFRRYDDADIAKMDEFEQPKYDPEAADRRMKRATFAKQLDAFLKTEGALAYATMRSEEHTSELQSLMRISYAVFCLKKKKYQHSQS